MSDYFICFLFIFSCISLIRLPAFDDAQYISSSLLVLVGLVSYGSVYTSVKYSLHSLFWFLFLLFAILSYFWSGNTTYFIENIIHVILLITSFLNFRLLVIVGLYPMMKYFLTSLFFISCSVFFLYSLFYGINDVASWTGTLDANINYGYSYLIVAVVWLFNQDRFGIRLFGIFSSFVMGYLIWQSGILGAQISYILFIIFQVLILLFKYFNFSTIKYLFITLCLIILLLIVWFMINFLTLSFGFNSDISDRFLLLKGSIEIFKECILYGHGIGQWYVSIQELYIENSSSSQAIHGFLKINNHSLFSKISVELGLIGVLLFYIPILYLFIKLFTNFHTYEKSIFTYFIIFLSLFFSEIYASFQFSFGHFSNLFYLLMFFLAEIDINVQHGK